MPHDSVWCITTMALSRLMLSMDNISLTMKSEGDEGNESVATHTPSGLAETVYLDSLRQSSKEQIRRSWSHSAEEAGQTIPWRVQSPLVSNPSANAAQYPGEISGSDVGYESDPQLSPSLRSTSSIPFVYARPLPPLPRPAIIRTSYKQFTSRTHFTSSTTLRQGGHRSATSQRADVNTLSSQDGIFDLSRYQNDSMTWEVPEEIQEVSIRRTRPSISSFGPSDSQLLTDNTWQGMISYSRAL